MPNEEVFEEFLKTAAPELYYIYKILQKGKVRHDELMEVAHKMHLVKSMDDGFGKVLVEMNGDTKKQKAFVRVRLFQDKVMLPIKDEKEIDL